MTLLLSVRSLSPKPAGLASQMFAGRLQIRSGWESQYLRSNIPQTALVATLDTYDLIIFPVMFMFIYYHSTTNLSTFSGKFCFFKYSHIAKKKSQKCESYRILTR
jgi:hypothetical protein